MNLVRLAVLAAVACILSILAVASYANAETGPGQDVVLHETAFPQRARMMPPAPQVESIPVPEPAKEPEPEPEPVEDSRYTVYDVPLSEELQNYTQDLCEDYGVSYPLVIAIMQLESEFQPDVVSSTNDYGIMQINRVNHGWLEGDLGITDWFDPQQNILAGVYMLSQFNDCEDVHKVLMFYNCGPSGAKRLWSEGVHSTAYSRAVVEIMDGLEVMENG